MENEKSYNDAASTIKSSVVFMRHREMAVTSEAPKISWSLFLVSFWSQISVPTKVLSKVWFHLYGMKGYTIHVYNTETPSHASGPIESLCSNQAWTRMASLQRRECGSRSWIVNDFITYVALWCVCVRAQESKPVVSNIILRHS